MSMSEKMDLRLDAVENAKLLLDQWGDSLAQVLESMTDQRPEVHWQTVTGLLSEIAQSTGAGPEADMLWWEQPFQVSPEMMVWVAAPRATWEYAGTLTLKAAGLETVESGEARNTWFEILGQSLSAMARSIGSFLGREVTCESGVERSPDPAQQEWASVSLKFADQELAPLLVALSPALVTAISALRRLRLKRKRMRLRRNGLSRERRNRRRNAPAPWICCWTSICRSAFRSAKPSSP